MVGKMLINAQLRAKNSHAAPALDKLASSTICPTTTPTVIIPAAFPLVDAPIDPLMV